MESYEKQFLFAAAMFLGCRISAMDEYHSSHAFDRFGSLLGEMDWTIEMRLIIKEWRNGNQKTY